MARIFTTPEAERTAKAWLHDLTLAAGVRSKNQRPNGSAKFSSGFVQNATIVCNEVINRDFANVDQAVRGLSHIRFDANMDPAGRSSWKSFKPEGIAKSLVYLAELLGIYWDDTIRTPYEIDEFKNTMLGAAVYKYNRYISAIPSKSRRASSSGTAQTSNGGAAASAQPPKNGYKQSGPQSGNVRDLQGNPGEKVYAEGNFIYKIIGDNPQSKNIPNVFVKPLSASGAVGQTNRIFISSGNGYTDCTCYFDDPNDATAFLNKILQKYTLPSNITNLRVVKNKADSNGYFLVGTEFGVCAVSAKTLNEALSESVNETLDRKVDWEKATAGYKQEELDELHTWMRRD